VRALVDHLAEELGPEPAWDAASARGARRRSKPRA
jgi:hypothetical protein